MKSLFLSLCLIRVTIGYTQEGLLTSTPAIATGAYSSYFTDAFAQLNNPAALANLPQLSAGVYAEKKFLLTELNQFTGVIGIPVGNDGLGIATSWMGYSGYNESVAGIGYGKNLGKVRVGIQCNYTMLRLAGYGNDGAVGSAAGSLWQVTDKLVTGIKIVNPIGGRFGKQRDEKLPAIYEMGLGFTASKSFLLCAAFIKEENKPVDVHAGLQYIFAGKFFTRLGITVAAASPYFGAGWQWKNMGANLLVQYHTILGVSPGLQLVFYGKKGNDK